MRISDWSSDVCSSDLSHITSFSQNLVLATTSPTVRRSFDRGGEQKSSPNSTSAASTVSVPPQRQKWPNLALKRGSIFATSRSEEHTSELQSLMRISYAVFCLKKQTNINTQHPTYIY